MRLILTLVSSVENSKKTAARPQNTTSDMIYLITNSSFCDNGVHIVDDPRISCRGREECNDHTSWVVVGGFVPWRSCWVVDQGASHFKFLRLVREISETRKQSAATGFISGSALHYLSTSIPVLSLESRSQLRAPRPACSQWELRACWAV